MVIEQNFVQPLASAAGAIFINLYKDPSRCNDVDGCAISKTLDCNEKKQGLPAATDRPCGAEQGKSCAEFMQQVGCSSPDHSNRFVSASMK
jgi:hypothetical protein